MTTDELPFPHRRGIEKLVQRFESSRRGGLFLCVGACEDTSHRVADAMRAKLGFSEIVETRISKNEPDPWSVILAARNHPKQIVAARLTDDPAPETLRKLDVQRELLHQERVVLLLWVSLGTLRTLADTAPNLWSVRRDVVWFLSYKDIQITSLALPSDLTQSEDSDRKLVEIDEEIAALGAGSDGERVLRKAHILRQMGRYREALALIRPLRVEDLSLVRQSDWALLFLLLLLNLGQEKDAERFVQGLSKERLIPGQKEILLAIWANRRQDFKLIFESVDWLREGGGQLRATWNFQRQISRWAPLLTEVAMSLRMAGHLEMLESWLQEAETTLYGDESISKFESINSFNSSQRSLVSASIERVRAMVDWEKFDFLSSLEHLQASLRFAEASGSLLRQRDTLSLFARYYASMGYREEASRFFEKVLRVHGRLHDEPRSKSVRPYKPSPFVRLSLAVKEAESFLSQGRLRAIRETFKRCQQAWQDEDPRYRSLYLRARWKKVEARWLVTQSDPQRAVDVLRETMAEVSELPRTRLDLLVTLAQLGPTVDAAVREAAAEEALSIALTAEALSVERDARRVLAPFARERGDETLAAFHEEEARKIDEALADLPSGDDVSSDPDDTPS